MGGTNGGRKKLPTIVKSARGTLQKCRTEGEFLPARCPDYVPDPPQEFSDKAKDIYFLTTNELRAKGILDSTDLHALLMFCKSFATWLEFEQLPKTEIVIDKQGNEITIVSAAFKIAKQEQAMAIKLAGEFGFTPVSRERIKVRVQQPKDEDEAFF